MLRFTPRALRLPSCRHSSALPLARVRWLSVEAPGGGGGSGGSGGAPPPPPPPPPAPQPSLLYRLREDFKDVLSVAFGWERARNLEEEYDRGLRAYPWVTYSDPATGEAVYRNTESGATTGTKPLDFDRRASASAFKATNTAASQVMVTAPQLSPWERTLRALGSTPLIRSLLAVGDEIAAGPVGKAAKGVHTRVSEVREDLQEKWETSQHPIIVNAAYVVDSVMAETEQGRAMREIKALDSGFDEIAFLEEMSGTFIPLLSRAFFRLDGPVLALHCASSALAQMQAVGAARQLEGLEHDGTILAVSKVELLKATQVEDEKGGSQPLLLVSAQVQYIHAVRNKKGEIVEGSDSEIRMAVFVLAVKREWSPEKGELSWKALEVAMHGSQLYL